jgi:hypothetical protein
VAPLAVAALAVAALAVAALAVAALAVAALADMRALPETTPPEVAEWLAESAARPECSTRLRAVATPTGWSFPEACGWCRRSSGVPIGARMDQAAP